MDSTLWTTPAWESSTALDMLSNATPFSNITRRMPPKMPRNGPDWTTPRSIHFIAFGVILPLGILFNVLSFVVFASSPRLRKTTTGHYLIGLAVADTLFMFGELIRWVNTPAMGHLGIFVDFMDHNNGVCKTVFFIRYGSKLASAWITVAITMERFITVAFPLKVARISTTKIAKIMVITLFLVSFLLGSYTLWTVGVIPHRKGTACLISNPDLYNIFSWIVLRVGSLLLPGLLVLIFTVLIIIYLSRAKHVRMRKLSTNSVNSCNARHSSQKLERQLTMMLLSVAVAFLLLRLPYTVTFYINTYKKDLYPGISVWKRHQIFFINKMSDILATLNYAINFFLYCWCGSSFRKQLKSIFCCKPNNVRRGSNFTASSAISSRNGSMRSNFGNQVELKSNGPSAAKWHKLDKK